MYESPTWLQLASQVTDPVPLSLGPLQVPTVHTGHYFAVVSCQREVIVRPGSHLQRLAISTPKLQIRYLVLVVAASFDFLQVVASCRLEKVVF